MAKLCCYLKSYRVPGFLQVSFWVWPCPFMLSTASQKHTSRWTVYSNLPLDVNISVCMRACAFVPSVAWINFTHISLRHITCITHISICLKLTRTI